MDFSKGGSGLALSRLELGAEGGGRPAANRQGLGQIPPATCLPAWQVVRSPPPRLEEQQSQQLWGHLLGRAWWGPCWQLRAGPGPGQGEDLGQGTGAGGSGQLVPRTRGPDRWAGRPSSWAANNWRRWCGGVSWGADPAPELCVHGGGGEVQGVWHKSGDNGGIFWAPRPERLCPMTAPSIWLPWSRAFCLRKASFCSPEDSGGPGMCLLRG